MPAVEPIAPAVVSEPVVNEAPAITPEPPTYVAPAYVAPAYVAPAYVVPAPPAPIATPEPTAAPEPVPAPEPIAEPAPPAYEIPSGVAEPAAAAPVEPALEAPAPDYSDQSLITPFPAAASEALPAEALTAEAEFPIEPDVTLDPRSLQILGLQQQSADALRAEVADQAFVTAHLEWSQAGTQHSARAYLLDEAGTLTRIEIPDSAENILGQLRLVTANATDGAWFSAHVSITSDPAADNTALEWNERPYWNSPDARMSTAPAGEPFPTDELWLADLERFPRAADKVPAWLSASTALPGAASASLRERLTKSGYPQEALVLPGDPPGSADVALEGALEVRQVGSKRYAVGVRDYGVFEPFHTAPSEREACDWLWSFLLRQMPPATAVAQYDLQQRSSGYRPAYAQLYAQLQAGGGSLLTTLPPGIALDRLGAIDGVFLFPWGTPVPQRALPPHASGGNSRLYQFVTMRPLHFEAEIVQPWFGQPGGAIRLRLATDGTGVRQLLQSGALVEVRVAG